MMDSVLWLCSMCCSVNSVHFAEAQWKRNTWSGKERRRVERKTIKKNWKNFEEIKVFQSFGCHFCSDFKRGRLCWKKKPCERVPHKGAGDRKKTLKRHLGDYVTTIFLPMVFSSKRNFTFKNSNHIILLIFHILLTLAILRLSNLFYSKSSRPYGACWMVCMQTQTWHFALWESAFVAPISARNLELRDWSPRSAFVQSFEVPNGDPNDPDDGE